MEVDYSIINNNLKRMNSNQKGGMRSVINHESIGVNAGIVDGLSCVFVNYYYNQNNGVIEYFGNLPIPSTIIENFLPGRLRLTFNDHNNGQLRIIEFSYEHPKKGNVCETAKLHLEKTIECFNNEEERKFR